MASNGSSSGRIAFGLPLLRITRRINDEPADRSRLWSGRSVRVAVTADSSGIPPWLQMPWLEIAEVVPRGGVVAGSLAASGLASPDEPLLISYQLTPESPGQVRFDGVAVEAGDAHGFFRWTTVRRRPSLLRVLPTPIDLRGRHGRQAGERPAPARHAPLQEGRVGHRTARPPRLTPPIASHLLANRDPVGLVVLGDAESSWLAPATGPRQKAQLLERVGEAAALSPAPHPCPLEYVVPAALTTLVHALYPDLLDPRVNAAPPPGYSRLGHRLRSVSLVDDRLPFDAGGDRASRLARNFDRIEVATRLVARGPGRVGGTRLPGDPGPDARPLRAADGPTFRKRMAAILSARHGLGPAGIALLLRDHALYSVHLQAFLDAHQVPYHRPLFDRDGNFLYRTPRKIELFTRALLRSVAHGRDNELFILFIDLLMLTDTWSPLLDAVKVARSRHHQVVMVVPTPVAEVVLKSAPAAPIADLLARDYADPAEVLADLDERHLRKARADLRQGLDRLRIPVLFAAGPTRWRRSCGGSKPVRAARPHV